MDAAMASLLILQTAVDEGLGACFFGVPPERGADAVRAEFAIPDAVRPGRRDHARPSRCHAPARQGSPTRRPRKDLDEVVHRGQLESSPTDMGPVHRFRAPRATRHPDAAVSDPRSSPLGPSE